MMSAAVATIISSRRSWLVGAADRADGGRQRQRLAEILRKAFLRQAPLQTLDFGLLSSDRRGGIGRRRP